MRSVRACRTGHCVRAVYWDFSLCVGLGHVELGIVCELFTGIYLCA